MFKKNISLLGFALSALLIASVQSAQATVITFEGHYNTQYQSTITRNGFDFGILAGFEQHFHEVDSTQFGLVSNGTGILLIDRDTKAFAAKNGGGAFLANSIDVASSGSSNQGSSTGLNISAYLNNTLVGSTFVAFGISSPFQTINLASFGNIDRLVFDGNNGGFGLDNAVFNGAVTAVPESNGFILFCMALSGLVCLRRFKKAK